MVSCLAQTPAVGSAAAAERHAGQSQTDVAEQKRVPRHAFELVAAAAAAAPKPASKRSLAGHALLHDQPLEDETVAARELQIRQQRQLAAKYASSTVLSLIACSVFWAVRR